MECFESVLTVMPVLSERGKPVYLSLFVSLDGAPTLNCLTRLQTHHIPATPASCCFIVFVRKMRRRDSEIRKAFAVDRGWPCREFSFLTGKPPQQLFMAQSTTAGDISQSRPNDILSGIRDPGRTSQAFIAVPESDSALKGFGIPCANDQTPGTSTASV